MSRKRNISTGHNCPVCKKRLEANLYKNCKQSQFFPFCSQRCKLVDLGAWFDSEYRIISEPDDTAGEKNGDK